MDDLKLDRREATEEVGNVDQLTWQIPAVFPLVLPLGHVTLAMLQVPSGPIAESLPCAPSRLFNGKLLFKDSESAFLLPIVSVPSPPFVYAHSVFVELKLIGTSPKPSPFTSISTVVEARSDSASSR